MSVLPLNASLLNENIKFFKMEKSTLDKINIYFCVTRKPDMRVNKCCQNCLG